MIVATKQSKRDCPKACILSSSQQLSFLRCYGLNLTFLDLRQGPTSLVVRSGEAHPAVMSLDFIVLVKLEVYIMYSEQDTLMQ